MLQWHGQGGHLINDGLPMYGTIDWKPENGCEIQNTACGQSGVMLQFTLVKTVGQENANVIKDEYGNKHGTTVMKFLVGLWVRTDHCICADSSFSSVNAAEEIAGFCFIGVVKTVTKTFPMTYLLNLELVQCGDYEGLTEFCHMAHFWMSYGRCTISGSPMGRSEGLPRRWTG